MKAAWRCAILVVGRPATAPSASTYSEQTFDIIVYSGTDSSAVWALIDMLGAFLASRSSSSTYLQVTNPPFRSLRALSRMINLRQLSLFGGEFPDLGILADLSTLPYLEDLKAQFSPDAAFVTHTKFPSTAFVALKNLDIETPALSESLRAILEAPPVGGLQSLTITLLDEPSEPEERRYTLWERYFQIISSRFSASMTTLIVARDSNKYSFVSGMSSSELENAFSVSLFEPLFDMRKLQKVDLSEMHWAMKTFGDKGAC